MNRPAKFLLVSSLALAIGATAALADTTSRKRKKSLFESIFGSSSSRSDRNERRQRRLFGDKWWQENQRTDSVRIINGQDTRQTKRRKPQVIVASEDDDPEGDPGFGMGNLTYAPDKLVPLGALKLSETPPAETAAKSVYDVLTAPDSVMRTRPEVRDALVDHYKNHGFRPIWVDNGKLSSRGTEVLKLLAAADTEGLEAASYLPASLAGFDAGPPQDDMAAMARFDIELSAAALKYAHDASGGQFDPKRLSLYHDIKPGWVAASQSIKVLAWSPFAADYLRRLHPSHPVYAAMKAALAELRAKLGGNPLIGPIADGPVVRKGNTDVRVPAVRQRLADLGYPQALEAADDTELLDADLTTQLRLFQKASAVVSDGHLGPQTVRALNSDHSAANAAKLLDNMERMRWLPKDLGTRHVFVNQAAFEVKVIDKGVAVWESRVIVGRPLTQTSAFHDEMETVVFNPSWGVPQSIITNEYLPKLRRDPGYLDRIGFKVIDASGKAVSSRSVDWSSSSNRASYGVQQPPGAKNALGELKFLFPNAHSIYMHDTPSRQLFDEDMRAFSHGCVRVRNPREFAQVILGWDFDKIDEYTDSLKSQSIKLPVKVPVHLTYFTAWPDASGEIVYFNDIYGRDKAMDQARSSIVVAER